MTGVRYLPEIAEADCFGSTINRIFEADIHAAGRIKETINEMGSTRAGRGPLTMDLFIPKTYKGLQSGHPDWAGPLSIADVARQPVFVEVFRKGYHDHRHVREPMACTARSHPEDRSDGNGGQTMVDKQTLAGRREAMFQEFVPLH
jgi:hypothetical protein